MKAVTFTILSSVPIYAHNVPIPECLIHLSLFLDLIHMTHQTFCMGFLITKHFFLQNRFSGWIKPRNNLRNKRDPTHLIKGWKKQERSVNTVANTSVSMNILTVHLKQVILTEIDAQPLLQHVSVITMHWGLRHPAVHLENWTCECTYHEELELCRREEITQMGKISANKLMSAQNRVYFERQLMNDGVHSTFTMSRCVNQWNSRAWQAERLRR